MYDKRSGQLEAKPPAPVDGELPEGVAFELPRHEQVPRLIERLSGVQTVWFHPLDFHMVVAANGGRKPWIVSATDGITELRQHRQCPAGQGLAVRRSE